MKKVLFILGVLLSFELFCACSKSDETTDDNNGEVKDWGTRPSDRTSWTSRGWTYGQTGWIIYNEDLQLWHFISSWPYTEIYEDYYPIELSDEFKVDGLWVTIDGNLYWDEEEQGEFIPEEVCNLEIRNLYGYDLTIVDDVVSSAKTSVVSVADIEAGTIENAKPIYVHPLDIRGDDFSICCFVFNNDPEPLTKDSFVDWMDSLFEVVGDAIRVLASGGCNAGGSVYPAIFVIRRASTDPNLFGINFRTESGNANINFTDSATFKAGITVFNDGVNKIN